MNVKKYLKTRKYRKRPARRRYPRLRAGEARVRLIAAAAFAALIFCALLAVNSGGPEKSYSFPKNDDVAAFRIPAAALLALRELSLKYEVELSELVTIYSLDNGFFLESAPIITDMEYMEKVYIKNYNDYREKYPRSKYSGYYALLSGIFSEIKAFPIAAGFGGEDYMYGDSFLAPRNYEGSAKHYGTDVMDRANSRGVIPVVSMTSGVIRDIGWSEKGGYNIGIVSQSGNYYYYAHFASFADGLHAGDAVSPSQPLGLMGDSGYSKKEGAVGNFPVHLHVGIYPNGFANGDFCINPYPFLRAVEAAVITEE